MPSFKAGGKEYLLTIDGPKIRRVRDAVKVDGVGLDLVSRDASSFQKLADEPLLVQEVLSVLCRSQYEANGLTDEQFQESLSGDDGYNAANALVEAIIDFFPSRQQKVLREMLATSREAEAEIHATAQRRTADPRLRAALKAKGAAEVNQAFDDLLSELGLTPLSSATSLPDGAESNPTA